MTDKNAISQEELKKFIPQPAPQSVRTTFKLQEDNAAALKKLAKEQGITVKDHFDVICNKAFIDATVKVYSKTPGAFNKSWNEEKNLIRKTYVINKSSVALLEKTAKTLHVSRDCLFDALLKFYRYIVAKREEDIEKSKENHPKALKLLYELSKRVGKTEEQVKKILDPEDPIYSRIGFVSIVLDNLIFAVENELKDGTPIDPDDFSQSC
ncbi:MAG: hypothetical protein SWC96_09880 [Thermodesulfobacteriota bacterium]|nr:hypothetical protein [Thermodesulfobacteriota bacterium]